MIYLILASTYKQSKLVDDAIIPFYCTEKDLAESAIRILLAKMYKKLESNGKKPRMESSYDSEMIAKGKCRVYFQYDKKPSYMVFRLYELPKATSRDDIRERLE